MDNEDFIAAVKLYVRDSAIQGCLENFSDPPGRAPAADLVRLSKWYNALDDYGKEMVRQVVIDSVDSGLFGLFCVIDGVRRIDDKDPSGEFKLLYVNQSQEILLNDFDEEFLHDLYNIETSA